MASKFKKSIMTTVLTFDYDLTLCGDEKTPTKESFIELVHAVRRALGVPLIILTAGSVNTLGTSGSGVIRPHDFARMCGLRSIINDFNINADVCCFGQYMSNGNDIGKGAPLYIKGGGNSYRPVTMIGNTTYQVLNARGEKKLSVLYHILLQHGLNAEIVFVDDMYFHDMSGLEGMIVDPFECVPSYYYLVNPLDNHNCSDRLHEMAGEIDKGTIKKYLEGESRSVWRRYHN
jgi:hypothetical protein